MPGAGRQHRCARPSTGGAGRVGAGRRRTRVAAVHDSSAGSAPACAPTLGDHARARRLVRRRGRRARRSPGDGIALTPFGSTRTLPNGRERVVRPARPRARRARPRRSASIGSWRSTSRVVPAWLASPSRSKPPPAVRPDRAGRRRPARRGRPGRGPARRAARRRCRSGAASRGSRPERAPGRARPRPSPRPWSTPSASRSARARSASSAPVSSRDPAQATPKRAPSSSAKLTTPIGRAGVKPSRPQQLERGEARTRRRAARRTRRRRAPSPGGCRGPARAGRPTAASGSPHQAHWLPARSG